MDRVASLSEALSIIRKYAPDAVFETEEYIYYVHIGKKVPTESDIAALKRLGWTYAEHQIFKLR